MRRRRSKPDATASELHRAPIISARLIIREATRADAQALDETMVAADLDEGDRTSDGARRFGAGLAEVPVWTATRAVCEKGSARIVGGVVLTDVDDQTGDVRRIGWWLGSGFEGYAAELINTVDERLRAMGADVVVMHLRADAELALRIAEAVGFRRRGTVRHTTPAGRHIDFLEYSRP